MFTGLVREVGTVRFVRRSGESAVIGVFAPEIFPLLSLGDSVAVNGVCLTVTSLSDSVFSADVSFETVRRSTLGSLSVGDAVNLEPALAVGERLGGHIVSGHVDGLARLVSRKRASGGELFVFSVEPSLLRYVAEKGSVCLDGVSLTVANRLADGFSVAVIPHTLSVTTLGRLSPGDFVNFECDVIARYVEVLMGSASYAGGLSEERLRELGF